MPTVLCTESAAWVRCVETVDLAELERSLRQERTAEGRALAVERGVRMGRPPALDAGQRREARRLLAEGKAAAEIGRLSGFGRRTVSRLEV